MNEWEEVDNCLVKKYEFADFESALDFVNEVGDLADEYGHHPDIKFGWGYAEVSLTTHEENAVTSIDHSVAQAIDETYTTHN